MSNPYSRSTRRSTRSSQGVSDDSRGQIIGAMMNTGNAEFPEPRRTGCNAAMRAHRQRIGARLLRHGWLTFRRKVKKP